MFVESVADAGMRDSFGIVRLSGNAGNLKRKYCKVSRNELESRREGVKMFVFLLLAQESW